MVKMEPNAIHPAAFMNQPVATPHQPRYAQQLPPGGSQEEETISNLQLTYHVVPGTAGRQVGDPYKLRSFWRFPFNESLCCVCFGRLRASPTDSKDSGEWKPTYSYKFRASLKKPPATKWLQEVVIYVGLFAVGGASQGNVMVAALHNGDGGNQRQLGIPLQIGDVGHAHVAHGALDLV